MGAQALIPVRSAMQRLTGLPGLYELWSDGPGTARQSGALRPQDMFSLITLSADTHIL